jgi:ubiquinone/menaquinone biosynthesis C-methylase UbiE
MPESMTAEPVPAPRGEEVRRYFDGTAARFDAIYRDDKPLSQRLVDRLFRRVVHRRFELTFALCGELAGRRVLDVGSGSGRYAIECARRGAEVVGVDFAPAMVEMARQAAAAAGVSERCRFVAGDFLQWRAPEAFDVGLAIGFFDYTPAPEEMLRRIRSLVRQQALFSFPVRWTARSATRWLRLRLAGCPVYFYGPAQVRRLLAEAGFGQVALHRLSRDYLVQASA